MMISRIGFGYASRCAPLYACVHESELLGGISFPMAPLSYFIIDTLSLFLSLCVCSRCCMQPCRSFPHTLVRACFPFCGNDKQLPLAAMNPTSPFLSLLGYTLP